ncbi:hypothetical protein HY772_04840 [Candidatus Woesearchaeota archaeon]|nr:hypothetical protein [Candidatus Woesearchaeota archaeon]
MPKRRSYEIKEKILLLVREKPLTYAELERKVNTGYRSIESNCEELEHYGQVKIDYIPKHPSNGRPAHQVIIAEQGRVSLKKGKKQ